MPSSAKCSLLQLNTLKLQMLWFLRLKIHDNQKMKLGASFKLFKFLYWKRILFQSEVMNVNLQKL